MGQHKLANKKPMATRWILSTKWFVEDKNAGGAVKEYWTPIGQPEVWAGKRRLGGVPFSYGSEEEARLALKEIVNLKFDGDQTPNLMFCALEVRYVPSRIKIYGKVWRDKYVKREVLLELVKPKFSDTINP